MSFAKMLLVNNINNCILPAGLATVLGSMAELIKACWFSEMDHGAIGKAYPFCKSYPALSILKTVLMCVWSRCPIRTPKCALAVSSIALLHPLCEMNQYHWQQHSVLQILYLNSLHFLMLS